MEELIEEQNQTPRWDAGDLYQFPSTLVLCVGVGRTFAQFITAEGMPLGDVQFLDLPNDVHFLHNTGLRYQYDNRNQLLRDFQTGFFTPYFEIL